MPFYRPITYAGEFVILGGNQRKKALIEISKLSFKKIKNRLEKQKQNPEHSTFEPSLDNIKDVYKPDLLLLPFDRTTESGKNPPQIDEDEYIPHH